MTGIRPAELPLSTGQTAVWLAHQLDPSGRRFVIAEYLELDGELDRDLLDRAWCRLVAETEALQVRAVRDAGGPGGAPHQVLDPAAANSPPAFLDFSTAADPAVAALSWMDAEHVSRVDLPAGPVSVAALLRVGATRHFFYHRYHHAVVDGYGSAQISRRLIAIYAALSAGTEPAPSQGVGLAALLAEDAAYRESGDLLADRRYWAGRLGDRPAPNRLAHRPLEGTGDRHPRRVRASTVLPPQLTAALRAVATDTRTSWPVVLTAITVGYVARLTDTRDVVLAVPVAARTTPATRATPCMVANTVAIRLALADGGSLTDLVPVVAAELRAALAHQRYRHEDVARDLDLPDAGVAALGPMINFMPIPAETRIGGLRAAAHNLSAGPAVDVTFAVQERSPGTGATFVVDGNPDHYDLAAVTGHRDRFVRFLAAAVGQPDHPLTGLDLLDPAERRRLLVDANDTGHPLPAATLPELFRQRVAAAPDAVAVAAGTDERELTYAELDRRTDRLAGALAGLGVGVEDVVAVMLPRSPALIVATLAAVKAGAAYLPIDPGYPADRIRQMLDDAAPACVLTTAAVAPAAPPGARLLLLDDAGSAAPAPIPPAGAETGGARPVPNPALRPDHPAYVIYTSGSTGRPKGVVASHAGVVNLAGDHIDRLAIGPDSRVLQFVSPGFDAAVADIWPALLAGACLVLAPAGRFLSGDELAGSLVNERITHAALPPVVVAGIPDVPLPALRALVTGGDVIAPDLVARWAAGRTMLNIYGPTEATVAATASPPLGGGRVTIGGPIRNTQVYVLDRGLAPLPAGAPGALYVAGAGVARGYLHQPGLTAERFVPCPFGPPGARMYRTGDLACWRPDGELDFLGRVDDQVKVRGFRVEPAEIEAVLAADPAVAKSVVVARADGGSGSRLVGYVVPAAGATPDPAGLRSLAAAALPDFMVPAAVVVLDAFPLTPNGKVDRSKLPAPRFAPARSSRPAGSAAEELVCGLFAEVLGLPGVGADGSFFDLGGDSIMAIQLVARLRAAGLAVSTRDVFAHPTPAALAPVARAVPDGGPAAEPAGAGIGPVAATPAMHWLSEVDGRTDGFNQAVVVQAPAAAGLTDLTAALQAVLDHHDALRLITPAGGEPAIRPPDALDAAACLSRVDIAGAGEAAVQAAVTREFHAARAALAPARGETVRAVWFDAGPARPGRLLLLAHHLVVDGVSWRILLPDLAAAWAAVRAGAPVSLPPAPTSLRRWAAGLAGAATDRARLAELPYWLAATDGEQPPAAPAAGPARYLQLALSTVDTLPLLTTVPAAFHARVEDVLLTGFVLAVAEWRRRRGAADRPDVLLELEGHGRGELTGRPGTDLSRTVGWFTAMFPVRLDPGGSSPGRPEWGSVEWSDVAAGAAPVGRALKAVKEQLAAVPDGGGGYGLLRYLNPAAGPRLAARPEPAVAFNYLGRLGPVGGGDWSLLPDALPLGGGRDPAMPATRELQLDAVAYETPAGPALTAMLTWPDQTRPDQTQPGAAEFAELWAAALAGLCRHAERDGSGGHSPSDFPLAALTQEQVDALDRLHPELTEILPLTPLQEGLLVQALAGRDGEDAYVAQLRVELAGPLDVAALRAAAGALLDRHPVLTAAFEYGDAADLARPVQVLRAGTEPAWSEVDLRDLPPGAAERVAAELADRDRAEPFPLDGPPLLRFLLVRLGARRWRLLLTNHHLLWDGWSTPVLLDELFALYRDKGETGVLPPAPPFRSYLAWLADQDRPAAASAWSAALAGLPGPTLIAPGAAGPAPVRHRQRRVELSTSDTERLDALAHRLGVTLNTVLCGAWGLLLARLTGSDDVVFGTSVAGRPAELPGVERMVGMFTATVPVRVRLDPDEPLTGLLARLQGEQVALADHHHLGPAEIQRAGGIGPLYDTTLVFLNYPRPAPVGAGEPDELRLLGVDGVDGTHFPVRLAVVPGARLGLWLGHRPDAVAADEADRMLARLVALLQTVLADPQLPTDEVSVLLADERQRLLADWGGYGRSEPATGSIH